MKYTELFNDKSRIYAAARPAYPARFYRFLSSLCPGDATVWDCGCGNGQSAVDLASYFDKIHASDVSPNQIEHAFAHPNVVYSVTPSEDTEYATGQFDLVCVAQALHWMKFEQFWPEVRRVLKPGGVFATWGYCWTSVTPDIDKLISDSILAAVSPYWAEQNKLLWDHYSDLDIPFRKIDSPTIPMTVNWNLDELFAFLHSWSATRRCMDDKGDEFFNAAYTKVLEIWGDANSKKQVEFDFFNLVYKR